MWQMFQGFLIPTQFQELELLQDRDNMNFVRDVFCLFFTDMTRQFSEIEQILWVKKCMNRTLINAKWLSWRFYWNFYNTLAHIYAYTFVYIYTLKIIDGFCIYTVEKKLMVSQGKTWIGYFNDSREVC